MKRLEGVRAVVMGAGKNMRARQPHGRFGQPEEKATMAAYLTSNEPGVEVCIVMNEEMTAR